jgi:hypothetical protein
MTALLPPESAATTNMSVECPGGYLTAGQTATRGDRTRGERLDVLGTREGTRLRRATLGTSVRNRVDHGTSNRSCGRSSGDAACWPGSSGHRAMRQRRRELAR